MAASEPMVNIRATLQLAHEQLVLDEVQKDSLLAVAKSTFYKQRSWIGLLEASVKLFGDKCLTGELKNWLQQNRVDLKKQDAVQMLQIMHQKREGFSIKPESEYHFEWTNVWDAVFYEHDQSAATEKSLDGNDQRVLDQLRLDPDQFQRYMDKALLSWICDNRVEIPVSDSGVRAALKEFRAENQLDSRTQLLNYMERVDVDEAQLTDLMQGVARIDCIRQAAGDLRSGIVDQLRLDGGYIELLEIANEKQKLLQIAGVNAEDSTVLPPRLLSWYFGQQLGGRIPQRLEDHLARIGLDNKGDFYRLITEDYLYWREQDR